MIPSIFMARTTRTAETKPEVQPKMMQVATPFRAARWYSSTALSIALSKACAFVSVGRSTSATDRVTSR